MSLKFLKKNEIVVKKSFYIVISKIGLRENLVIFKGNGFELEN